MSILNTIIFTLLLLDIMCPILLIFRILICWTIRNYVRSETSLQLSQEI